MEIRYPTYAEADLVVDPSRAPSMPRSTGFEAVKAQGILSEETNRATGSRVMSHEDTLPVDETRLTVALGDRS